MRLTNLPKGKYHVLTCYLNFFCLYQISKIANYQPMLVIKKFMFSDNSAVAPPDSIPNSEVKRSSADGSVGVPM